MVMLNVNLKKEVLSNLENVPLAFLKNSESGLTQTLNTRDFFFFF